MKIVVLLKIVPDTETRFQINNEGTDVVYDDGIEWIASPYDEYALEEAIKIKENSGGTVTILTLGKGHEAQVIRKALAMGADDAILIENVDLVKSDVVGIAKILAKQLESLNADLILAGKLATDSNDSYVPGAISELLGLPMVTDINELEVQDGKVTATRDAAGRKEKFEISLPAILSADKGLNEPRYPKLPDIMKAKKKPLEQSDGSGFSDLVTSNVKQIKVEFPPKKSGGMTFDGDIDESISKLIDALVNKEKVIQ
jgi:electron transfer flavoprotein beta subunit